MKKVTAIIVGAGPAGAACAKTLIEKGIDCLVLDKADFPRPKVCAGWITPEVFRDLKVIPEEYPHPLTRFSHLKIYLSRWPLILMGKQYAIRRIEFDQWLIKTSGAELIQHEVKQITRVSGKYLIDDRYKADYLIGAGGTHCPVRRQMFKDQPVRTGTQIVSLEEEYKFDWDDPTCRLWFFTRGLPGYAWYVPKKGGYVNLGIGANAAVLAAKGENIQEHWQSHIDKLIRSRKISPRSFQPKGYTYFLRGSSHPVMKENVILVGDSLGLATLDMGEGIGPAIKSGIQAARSIIEDRPYDLQGLSKYSLLPEALGWLIKKHNSE